MLVYLWAKLVSGIPKLSLPFPSVHKITPKVWGFYSTEYTKSFTSQEYTQYVYNIIKLIHFLGNSKKNWTPCKTFWEYMGNKSFYLSRDPNTFFTVICMFLANFLFKNREIQKRVYSSLHCYLSVFVAHFFLHNKFMFIFFLHHALYCPPPFLILYSLN